MHKHQPIKKEKGSMEQIMLGLILLAATAGYFFFFNRRTHFRRRRVPGKQIDIEIRYEKEKDADAAFLAQNMVKVLRIVLSPLESKIQKENARLIFVFAGDYWEMRMRNASKALKSSVKELLEAEEW